MIRTTGITRAHYECRSLRQTVPILEELLALDVLSEAPGQITMKHPNTDWPLVVHEAGPGAPDKPQFHHYGVRVATDREVDDAYEYLLRRKKDLGLKIIPPETRRIAHSVHFFEPGGNFWEIESYEGGAKKLGLGGEVAFPWKTALAADRFPGRSYVPQAVSHGTTTCTDLERARRFYRTVLGLEVMHHLPAVDPYYIKHPSAPWYIVCLPAPRESRVPSAVNERFTLGVESAWAVAEARAWLAANAADLGIAEPQRIVQNSGTPSFLFNDPDGNCWEIAAPSNGNI
jgi:catechol 2,3-dioxygenase-like lactoylglutathione lyase family enzyme